MPLHTINPATGEELEHHPAASAEAMEVQLAELGLEALSWRRRVLAARSDVLRTVATRLETEREALARLMALEMGKPVGQGRAEVDKCVWTCRFFADHAAGFLAPVNVPTGASKSYLTFEPLGVVLCVMPWNFPLWQVFRAAVPALMAGNGVVLKHASNVSGCALAIAKLMKGAPLRTLLVGSEAVAGLVAHPAVSAVSLTGSTPAGRAVASAAGAALKKCVLELGGSDAYVVLEDAELGLAVETCVASRLINSGQSCIAAKRFIVVDSVREAFTRAFVEQMQHQKLGDPLDDGTEVGPLARRDLRDGLHDQVERSVAAGARVLLGGVVPEGPGAFYPPTVLTDVRPGMAAFDEELFGPVAAIVSARDEDEAVALANRSVFGLGGAVFTADAARGERVAARLEAGCVCVNDLVKSDPRLPFGGIKASGYGRELGELGIREFVNVKSVIVR